jgi:hypothetical protein
MGGGRGCSSHLLYIYSYLFKQSQVAEVTCEAITRERMGLTSHLHPLMYFTSTKHYSIDRPSLGYEAEFMDVQFR